MVGEIGNVSENKSDAVSRVGPRLNTEPSTSTICARLVNLSKCCEKKRHGCGLRSCQAVAVFTVV